MFASIVLISLCSAMVLGVLWARESERKDWNRGICKRSGRRWRIFDVDSSGARGYKDGAGNYTWISYNVDQRSPFTPWEGPDAD